MSVPRQTHPAVPFIVPNVQPRFYAPGPQPNSPGESHIPDGNPHFSPIPWPNVVPTLLAWANNPGTPRANAPVPVINRVAPLLENFLFIGGIVQKSRG